MTEWELIQRITADLPGHPLVKVGVGDDCAVLEAAAPVDWLFKTDSVVEGTHFLADADPVAVGHKALGRVLSDVAAMAGEPVAALVAIGLPDGYDPAWVEGCYEGIRQLASKYQTAICGGETTRTPSGRWLTVSLLGKVPPGRAVLRTGAQVGDVLFVSGELGGSLTGRHLAFEPRIREAAWLTSQFSIHSMMDLSDGLAGDLRHLIGDSLGAELRAESIPVSRAAREQARISSQAKPPVLAALTDGEDFELLFSAAPSDAVAILDGWKARFPDVSLKCIGKITAQPGIRLLDKNGIQTLHAHGYTHFQ